ncbi:B- and T-lymphocyte attenuator, partial [Ophiophagus hannah]
MFSDVKDNISVPQIPFHFHNGPEVRITPGHVHRQRYTTASLVDADGGQLIDTWCTHCYQPANVDLWFLGRKYSNVNLAYLEPDSEDDNCTTITIERGTKYYTNLGDSASLECPVTYCSKKPEVNWYMLNKSEEKFHILNNEKERSSSWKNENKFVLHFQSVHKNDSGQYHCQAVVRKNNLASHVVELIVQGKFSGNIYAVYHLKLSSHQSSHNIVQRNASGVGQVYEVGKRQTL